MAPDERERPNRHANKPKPGDESEPTMIDEPDNTRSPNHPTPRHAQKPTSVADVENEGESE